MGEIKVTWDMLLAFAAALVTLSKGLDVLLRFTKPQRENRKRMERFERYLANDHARLEKAAFVHQVTLKTLILVLDHMIDGNNVEKMKQTRAMLQTQIVNMGTEDGDGPKDERVG